MAEDFDERVIARSQAVRSDDGVVALALYFDSGLPIAGALDLRTIAGIRRQLDIAASWLGSPTQPAQ